MNLSLQIENLRQRYWAGDASARAALHELLVADLESVLRRAMNVRGAASPIVAMVRRLVPNFTECANGMSVDFHAIGRKLCDHLLSRKAVLPRRELRTETQRFSTGTVVVRC